MKKIFILISIFILAFSLSSCNERSKNEKIEFDHSYFYGMCETSGDLGGGVDPGITNEWIKNATSAIGGIKTFRLWISLGNLFNVDEENNLSFNVKYLNGVKDYVKAVTDAGCDHLLALVTSFIYPSDYSTSTGYVVPDPNEETEYYCEFLSLQARGAKMLLDEVPEIKYFEPANEPELNSCIHKNGYVFGGSASVNSSFYYTDDERSGIILDMCYYIREAIREDHDDRYVLIPSLCNSESTIDFLDLIYRQIESRCFPSFTDYSVTDPDMYFDILNWHPYPTNTKGEIDDEWVDYQKRMYDVAINHSDNGKEVWFTEIGWTDWGNRSDQTRIANNYINMFDKTINELEFVTAVLMFRLTTLATQVASDNGSEENFGIFYNLDDPLYGGEAKEAAYAISKYINKENYDKSKLDNLKK